MKRLLTAPADRPDPRSTSASSRRRFAPRCRYYPTCSEYAVQAIRELGPIRGSILAGWRLLRCNPFSHGGVDELSDRRLFRSTPTRSERATARPAAAGRPAPASDRSADPAAPI